MGASGGPSAVAHLSGRHTRAAPLQRRHPPRRHPNIHIPWLLALHPGRAVQVVPIKPTLKPPGTKRLKLKYEELPLNFAFKFHSRRYTQALNLYRHAWPSIFDGAPYSIGADARQGLKLIQCSAPT
jgi:hypothetical protein